MIPRSVIKTDLFADELQREKIDALVEPMAEIESHIDFAALAAEVDRVAPRTVSAQGGRQLWRPCAIRDCRALVAGHMKSF